MLPKEVADVTRKKQVSLVPPYVVYLESVEANGETFDVGESVWIEGWRKSPSSLNTLKQVVRNEKYDSLHVNVFCASKGRGQWHSFSPERLLKRTEKQKRRRKTNV